jgi:hypothetical protein
MNLHELNQLIKQLEDEKLDSNKTLLDFYYKKRFELIDRIIKKLMN